MKSPRSAEEVLASPSGFARSVLGLELYDKQAAVLDALAPEGAAVSFRSCNEGGKTRRVIASAILWHLAMFPAGQVVSTSGTYRQVRDQLVPALRGYAPRFPRWQFLQTPRILTENPGCFYLGFSTSDAGQFEGFHGGEGCPLLIIVDEAKTVKDPIFEAVERCRPTRLLLASSPGYAEGEFYRSQTTRAGFYKTFVQRAQDCAHWRPEDIARVRAKWGAEHPLVKSMIDAQFMEFVQNAIIDLKALEDLLAEPPPEKKGERHAFCDFAWGGDGDENVLALQEGNRVRVEEAFREGNLHGICGRFIGAFVRLGLKPSEIDGDEGGAGKMIIDQLGVMGWPIGRVNNGAAPRFDEHYFNLAAETWFEGASKIARREVILPDDNDLKAQLLNRKQVPNAKGKLAIESKRDMKKPGREGGPAQSPDRADAVLGAMMPVSGLRSFSTLREPTFHEELAEYQQNLQGSAETLPGGFCP